MSGTGDGGVKPKGAGAANAPAPAKRRDGAQVILLADDDPDIRTMLVRALGDHYTVYEARDGEEARRLLGAIPRPDAIVLDVMMPRLDGIELAKAIRKDPALQNVQSVPILFLTAKGTPQDILAGINAGARHYVTKPFSVGEVVAKITAMTRPKKS
jgi:DNA-binding response OmpR family regulator